MDSNEWEAIIETTKQALLQAVTGTADPYNQINFVTAVERACHLALHEIAPHYTNRIREYDIPEIGYRDPAGGGEIWIDALSLMKYGDLLVRNSDGEIVPAHRLFFHAPNDRRMQIAHYDGKTTFMDEDWQDVPFVPAGLSDTD